jgi:hypothetical protein
MGCLPSPFRLATPVTAAKRAVSAHPSNEIGASPQPTRRGPNQGFSPMIGVVRTQGSSRGGAAAANAAAASAWLTTSLVDLDRLRSYLVKELSSARLPRRSRCRTL